VAISTDDIARTATLKASWRILPLLGLGYLMSYIDRVNVSFAASQMNADLGFSASVYGFGSGLFFLSYALFEVPSGMAVTRVGPRRWIARIMLTWGVLAAGMMFVSTPTQFYIMRFLLGMAEAGYFPCALYCVSQWFPVAHRGRATSRFYCFGGVSGIVMGLLSGWLLSLDGMAGLRGWQWLFLVEGLPAIIIGLAVLFFLPDGPAQAKWLTPAERGWIEGELAREAVQFSAPKDHNILAALRDRHVLHLAVIGLLTIGSYMSFQLFLPQLLAAGTGLDAVHVGYLVSVAGVFLVVGMVASGWHSDRQGQRFTHLLIGCALVAAAFLVMALAPSPGILLAAYYAISFFWPSVTLSTLVMCTEIVPKRTVGVASAAVNTLSQLGAFAGPWLVGISKDASGSYHLAQMILPIGFVLSVALTLNLRRELRAKQPLVAARAIPAA
jgi:ACS family tartrate transporter-like MFS transporter